MEIARNMKICFLISVNSPVRHVQESKLANQRQVISLIKLVLNLTSILVSHKEPPAVRTALNLFPPHEIPLDQSWHGSLHCSSIP
jgi:hypothetical protein